MTAAERALWERVQRRARSLSPDVAAAILLAFAAIRDRVSEAQLTRAVERGTVDQVIEEVVTAIALTAAFQPVRERLRGGLVASVKYFTKALPVPPVAGRTLVLSFDALNPRVLDAVRTLETKVITSLEDDITAVVRTAAEQGLRDGVNPRAVGRQIRSVIGLGPTQEQEVRNFRAALEGRDGRSPFDYQRRDKRFDATIRRAFDAGEGLPADRIDRMVETYRKRRIAWNAETVARTAALDAQKMGQRLSWEDAIGTGIVDRDRLMKQRIGVDDARERDEHRAINNEVRHFDAPYSNGEMVSGDLSWNCRCIDRYYLAATV